MNGSPDTGWELTLSTGEVITEDTKRWSEVAEEQVVAYFGGKKRVFLAPAQAVRLRVFHDGLDETIEIPERHRAYQAARATAHLIGGEWTNKDIGRVVGLVLNGEVVEERFLDGVAQEVKGARK